MSAHWLRGAGLPCPDPRAQVGAGFEATRLLLRALLGDDREGAALQAVLSARETWLERQYGRSVTLVVHVPKPLEPIGRADFV